MEFCMQRCEASCEVGIVDSKTCYAHRADLFSTVRLAPQFEPPSMSSAKAHLAVRYSRCLNLPHFEE